MFSTTAVLDSHCDRLAFEVTDIDTLARTVALVLIQEYELAKCLILGTTPGDSADISAADIDKIVARRLHGPPKFHRDGFLFQMDGVSPRMVTMDGGSESAGINRLGIENERVLCVGGQESDLNISHKFSPDLWIFKKSARSQRS